MNEAAGSLGREKYALYTSLGAAFALSLGPTVYDWAKGDLSAYAASYRAARTLSIAGAATGTDALLRRVAQGAWRGTLRGNGIVGAVTVIAETTWLVYEGGWQHAFYQPSFYEETIGGIGAVALGLAGGAVATTASVETGYFASVIGLGAAVITGSIGYLGGKAATHKLIEIFAPRLLLSQEKQRFASAKARIDALISNAATMRMRVT